jgi:hypothetical protein
MRLLIKLRMTISMVVKANSELHHCSYRCSSASTLQWCNFTLQQAGH